MTTSTSHRVQRFSFSSFGGEEKKAPEKLPDAAAVPVPTPAPLLQDVSVRHPAEPVQPLHPQPQHVISEAELEQARTEGYEKGRREGYAECESAVAKSEIQREETIKSLLEVIANRVTLAAEENAIYLADKLEVMNSLVMAVARKVAGDALKAAPYEGVEMLLRECMSLIAGKDKIVVVVAPSMASGLRQRIDGLRPLMPEFTGEIAVEEDETLGENDCRVEWRGGHAERDAAKLWKDLETVIMRMPLSKRL
ncbi:MAG TPA: FliH/SctL family protein [Rickettsiales bacterium]|nr:FliH/SctL family protein [Rickettsiales bacterium]